MKECLRWRLAAEIKKGQRLKCSSVEKENLLRTFKYDHETSRKEMIVDLLIHH